MRCWMVRAGVRGRFAEQFEARGVVSLGWRELGDPTGLRPDRNAFVEAMAQAYPEMSARQASVTASMVYRFTHVLERGDQVVTYDPGSRDYICGTVHTAARFDPDAVEEEHAIYREVKWHHRKSRDSLPESTLNSLGSIATLFEVSAQNAALLWDNAAALRRPADVVDEIADAGDGQAISSNSSADDLEEAAQLALQDRVVRLDDYDMERLVAGLLRAMGYRTRHSPRGPDRGSDIIATPDGFGFEDPRIVVEVKHRRGTRMGAPDVRAFLGGRQTHEKALFVSTGGFTQEARYEAERANIPFELVDMQRLVEWIGDAHDRFDDETRALLPLRRIVWPGG